MNNFNIANKALKDAWIPRLPTRSAASWQIISESELENLGGKMQLRLKVVEF